MRTNPISDFLTLVDWNRVPISGPLFWIYPFHVLPGLLSSWFICVSQLSDSAHFSFSPALRTLHLVHEITTRTHINYTYIHTDPGSRAYRCQCNEPSFLVLE